MKQFQQILRKELTKETPDIPQLKNSLVTTIEFSEHCDDPLEQPLWILIINIVAMDLLRLGFFLMRMEYVFFEQEKCADFYKYTFSLLKIEEKVYLFKSAHFSQL